MHNKLTETFRSLVAEGWSEIQDQQNVLPMRQFGMDTLTLLVSMFGAEHVVSVIDDLYKENFSEETDSGDF